MAHTLVSVVLGTGVGSVASGVGLLSGLVVHVDDWDECWWFGVEISVGRVQCCLSSSGGELSFEGSLSKYIPLPRSTSPHCASAIARHCQVLPPSDKQNLACLDAHGGAKVGVRQAPPP